jgi:hypothetical protein
VDRHRIPDPPIGLVLLYWTAPDAETLPQYAGLLHSFVAWLTVPVVACLLVIAVVKSILQDRLFRIAAYALSVCSVAVVDPMVRMSGSTIDSLIRSMLDNPLSAAAAVGAALLLVLSWRVAHLVFSQDERVYPALLVREGVAQKAGLRSESETSELDGLEPGWHADCASFAFRYWVTYAFRHAMGNGTGSASIARQAPITDGYAVAGIAEWLRQDLKRQHPEWTGVRVSVTSWQRFESPSPDPGAREDLPLPGTAANIIDFRRAG